MATFASTALQPRMWHTTSWPDGLKIPPMPGLDDDLLNFKNPPYEDLPPLGYTSRACRSHEPSTVSTNTTKSLPRRRKLVVSRPNQGHQERQNFIYIEDQYFVLVPELLDALMEVMPRIQRVIVVTKEQTNAFTNGGVHQVPLPKR